MAPESGPDFSTFGGSGAAGGIVGTNNLQSAVDKLTQTVNEFESAVDQISAFAKTLPGKGSNAASGTFVSGAQFPQMANPFAGAGWSSWASGSQVSGPQTASNAGNVSFAGGGWGGSPGGPTGWQSNGPGSPGGGGIPAYTSPTAGGTLGSTSSQPQPMGQTSMLRQFGSAVLGGATALGGYGASSMSGQLALNTYQWQSSLAMNGGNYTMNQSALARQAYGTAGGRGNPQLNNIFGNSPQDLAQAFAIMGAQAGNPILQQTGFGQNLLQGTAQFGYLNPAMSGAQSAMAMQQLYTPGMSLQQRMLGYTATPLQAGVPGGSRNMAQWVQGQFRTMNFGGQYQNPTPSEMAAQLGPNGVMYANLRAEGLNPSQYSSVFQTYNRLFQGIGTRGAAHPALSTSQAQGLMNQLASQNPNTVKAAQTTLGNYGINKNDLDQLKIMAGTQAAKQGDQSAGFTAGVQAFARSVSDFNTGVEKLLNTLGLNGAVGAGKGFLGGMSSLGGLGSIGGLGALAFGASRLLGLGGGGGLGGLLSGGGSAAGGAGAAATGGGLAAFAGTGLGALGVGALGAFGINSLSNMRGGPGVLGQFMKYISTVGTGNPLISTGVGRDISNWTHDLGSNISGLFGGGASGVGGVPGGASQSKNKNTNSITSGVSKQAVEAVHAADTQIGVPYVWGGETPGVGFDCSGLTQWAYERAGIHLPRTSQAQWAFLQNRSVSTSKVEEGDLVFTAGSDGTPNAPGHVGMMITKNALIQAPYTGADVQVIKYEPGAWSHAARPAGSLAGSSGPSGGLGGSTSGVQSPAGMAGAGSMGFAGTGGGMGDTSSEGSTSELAAFQGAISGGSSAGSGYTGSHAGSATGTTGAGGTGGGGKGGKGPSALPGGGTPAKNQAIGKKEAAAYGWASGTNWTDLVDLWNAESGWNNTAQNPTSTAYGIAQFLNSTWGPYGAKTSNPGLQIKYGLEYIKQRYGNPVQAWAHEESVHWYSKGGVAPAGSVGVVGERGPELVRFRHPTEVLNAKDSAKLMQSAMGPYSSSPSAGYNYSPASSAFQAGRGMARAGGGGPVTLNFGASSVVIQMPQSSGNSLPSGASARLMAKHFVQHLSKMDLYAAIANGANS